MAPRVEIFQVCFATVNYVQSSPIFTYHTYLYLYTYRAITVDIEIFASKISTFFKKIKLLVKNIFGS